MIILNPGVWTSIQDSGFMGYRQYGIGSSGVMDKSSFTILNTLLENPLNTPIIEMHFPAATIAFEEDALIAIGGGDFLPKINNQPIKNWKVYTVTLGDVLSFEKRINGARTYLAIKGGIKINFRSGSASTSMMHSFGGERIKKGSVLQTNIVNGSLLKAVKRIGNCALQPGPSLYSIPEEFQEIRYIPSNEVLEPNSIFTASSECNRMALRLYSNEKKLDPPPKKFSSATEFGTIQVLPDGSLAILMADHQTTGGYPRLGQVAAVDLPLLAQLWPGNTLKLKAISLEQAQELRLERDKEFLKFKASLGFFRNEH